MHFKKALAANTTSGQARKQQTVSKMRHQLCNEADHRLFNMILQPLEQLLLPVLPQSYNLRKRLHSIGLDRFETAVLIKQIAF